MRPSPHTRLGFTLLACLCLTTAATAQSATTPRLSYVTPAGGKAGTTFEVTTAGRDLSSAEKLYFSIPGVRAVPIGESKTLPKTEQKKKRGGMKAAPTTSQRFRVTLPADAPPGIHDVRVITKDGISNPRAFVVGDLPEALEKESNDDVPKAQRIELNTVVHGVIGAPADVDYFIFSGKKGQRVVCACLTTSIDSRLPASLEMYSDTGRALGQARGYRDGDALLDVTLPADGDYYLRVCCFSYTQGGPDYFYRLAIAQTPWIDAAFPPAIEPGKEARVTLYGRNLPGGTPDPTAVVDGRTLDKLVVTIKAPVTAQRLTWDGRVEPFASALDGFTYRLKSVQGSSNAVALKYARVPVVLDQGANSTREQAQRIETPCEIAGRVEVRGDHDWYSFTARKGQVLGIEAFGERLGSPLDLVLRLHNEKGDVLTELDDVTDVQGPQFILRTDDPPYYRFSVPADGTYYLHVTSRESYVLAGPRHVYTVRIAPQEPDFRLVAMPPSSNDPSAAQLGTSGGVVLPVHVWRQEGFAGDVTLAGENLPPGLHVPTQRISAAQKFGLLILTADATAAPYVGPITLVGTAEVNGRKLTRTVRSATIVWPVPQVNIPTLTRLDRELVLSLRGKAPYRLTTGVEKVSTAAGGKLSIPVKFQPAEYKGNVQVTALGLPNTAKGQPLTLSASKTTGNLVLDVPTNFPPGTYSVALLGQTQPLKPNQQRPKGAPANLLQVAPPVAVTIVPKQLARFTVAAAKVQRGKETDIVVKAARQYSLPIAFEVEVIFPNGIKGLSARRATIPPDASAATVAIRAASDASIGTRTVTIRATARFEGNVPITHETKLQLTVTK